MSFDISDSVQAIQAHSYFKENDQISPWEAYHSWFRGWLPRIRASPDKSGLLSAAETKANTAKSIQASVRSDSLAAFVQGVTIYYEVSTLGQSQKPKKLKDLIRLEK